MLPPSRLSHGRRSRPHRRRSPDHYAHWLQNGSLLWYSLLCMTRPPRRTSQIDSQIARLRRFVTVSRSIDQTDRQLIEQHPWTLRAINHHRLRHSEHIGALRGFLPSGLFNARPHALSCAREPVDMGRRRTNLKISCPRSAERDARSTPIPALRPTTAREHGGDIYFVRIRAEALPPSAHCLPTLQVASSPTHPTRPRIQVVRHANLNITDRMFGM